MNTIKLRRPFSQPLATVDDAFNDLFERFAGGGFWRGASEWIPAVDIARTGDAVVVKVEVPGLKADDVELTVENNVLIITGAKQIENEETRGDYYHVERRFGNFCRHISLPSDVDAAKVTADCKDGVLTVTLPKTERAKARKIEVKGK